MCISDFWDWQGKAYIQLVQVKNKTYGVEVYLDINSDKVVDYTHLADALDTMHIQLKLVEFSWNSYSDNLHYFLVRTQVPNILVQNYNETNDKTPRRLLELQKLVSLSFKSSRETSLPRKFISLAQRKNVVTSLNDNFVVWREIDIRKLPYDMQINYNMSRRGFLIGETRPVSLMQIYNFSYKEDKDND